MDSKLACALAFVAGAAAGAVVAWSILKERYEQISKEEAESFRKIISEREKDKEAAEKEEDKQEHPTVSPESARVKPDLKEYETLLRKQGYFDEERGGSTVVEKPYVISPDEFGDNGEYETISLTYYSDGVLTDEFDEIITNIDDVVGLDSLNHFGEYEDDSVFVRNDDAMTDYEILLDTREYRKTHGAQSEDD